jgi:hypothetical protein
MEPMNDFEQIAKTEKNVGTFGEFWHFLAESKKWWLLPIIVVLLAFGLLVFLSGGAAAPFIYTLF